MPKFFEQGPDAQTLKISIDTEGLADRLRHAEKQFSDFTANHAHKVLEDLERKDVEHQAQRVKTLVGYAKIAEQNLKVSQKENELLEKKLTITEKINKDNKEAGRGTSVFTTSMSSGGGSSAPPESTDPLGKRPYESDDSGDPRRRARRWAGFGADVGYAASRYQQASWEGFSPASQARLAGGVLSAIPVAGPLFDTAANLFGNELDRTQDNETRRYHTYRRYGEDAYGALRGMHAPGGMRDKYVMQGMDEQEIEKLIQGGAGAGYRGSATLSTMAGLKSGFDIDSSPVLGSLRKAGIKDEKAAIDGLGSALGVAVTTGLEKARFGEAFTNLARAAQSVTNGMFSIANTASMQAFVGHMGPGFQGDTSSSRSAQATLQGMSQGAGGGLSEVYSLKAAGFGGGNAANFATAKLNAGLGIQGGGVKIEELLKQWANNPMVQNAWGPGTKPGRTPEKDTAAYVLGTPAGIDPVTFIQIMDQYMYNGAGDTISPLSAGITGALKSGAFTPSFGHDISTVQRSAYGKQSMLLDESKFSVDNPSGLNMSVGSSSAAQASPLSSNIRGSMWSGGNNSLAAVEAKYGGGAANMSFGQPRETTPDGRGGNVSGKRTHTSQDMYFPPGTPIATTEAGDIGNIGPTNGDPSVYGFTIEFHGVSGFSYKFNHIEKPMVVAGQKDVRAGTQLGTTIHREKFSPTGKSKTHLDMSIQDTSGHYLNPSKTLGVGGMNALTMGSLGIGGGGGQSAPSGGISVNVSDNRAVVTTTGNAFKPNGLFAGSK